MTNRKQRQNSTKKQANAYIKYSGLAFQMGAIIGLGTWGGSKIDEMRETDFPLFTLIFSLVSVFVALYLVLKQLIGKN